MASNKRLITIVCIQEGDTFRLLYLFEQDKKVITETVKVPVSKSETKSKVSEYPNATLYEREIYEQFGLKFTGHPELNPLFLSEEDVGTFPLRKEIEGVKK